MAAVLLGTAPACAQQADTPAEAVEFYRQAREHYEAGEYHQAADDLERALMLDPESPTLVYNLARVYELLGQPERALQRYEQYQRLLPQQQAQEQNRAEATIRRLQGATANQEEAAPPPSPREVAPLRQLPGLVLVRENGVADGLFFAVLVVGLTGLAGGAVFGGLAIDQNNRANDFVLRGDNSVMDRNNTRDLASGFALASDISFGLGAAGIIAAGLLYFLREHTVERPPIGAAGDDVEASLDVFADPYGGGAVLRVEL